jgi:hypothetical protein
MIVFTIVFGKEFIDEFFELCLASLLTDNNIPAIQDTDPTLLIATVAHDAAYIRERLRDERVRAVFGSRIELIWVKINASEQEQADVAAKNNRRIVYDLLMRSVAFCLNKKMPFLYAVSDLIYSDGAVKSAWALYQLTGKVVAIYNGRVEMHPDGIPYYVDRLADVNGIRDIFINEMSAPVRTLVTDDPTRAFGSQLGNEVYLDSGRLMVFASRPNPFLGRFASVDLVHLTEAGRFGAWDHTWGPYLFDNNRLFVQTNLDLGMSIEPDTPEKAATDFEKITERERMHQRRRDWFWQMVDDEDENKEEILRHYQLSAPMNVFCFSSAIY